MQIFFAMIGVYFLFAIISVSGNHCHKNVDEFIKRIFKGVKLSLDKDDLVALTDIKKGSCASTRKVYFSAYLKNHISASSLISRQPIKYTDVITNEGGGYDSSTGEFTAPKAGGYSFFWEFLVFPDGNIWLGLQKNSTFFAHNLAHGANGNYEVASKSTIMDLVKGEKVRVVFHGGNGKLYGGYRYTGFSGFSL